MLVELIENVEASAIDLEEEMDLDFVLRNFRLTINFVRSLVEQERPTKLGLAVPSVKWSRSERLLN